MSAINKAMQRREVDKFWIRGKILKAEVEIFQRYLECRAIPGGEPVGNRWGFFFCLSCETVRSVPHSSEPPINRCGNSHAVDSLEPLKVKPDHWNDAYESVGFPPLFNDI